MPLLTLDVMKGRGPVIEVFVGPTPEWSVGLARSGRPPSYAQPTFALIDSGAATSVVSEFIIERLGPEPTGQMTMHSATTGPGGGIVPVHDVRLTFSRPHPPLDFSPLPVVAAPLSGFEVGMLLGRDVLSRCLFVYSGSDDRFTIEY